ncbi:MAG: hypothetical protein RL700_1660 [Pseudomonadota bacterium]
MTTDDSGGAAESVPILAPSLLRRMSCWIYEGMLLFAVVFMASYLFSSLTQTRHGLQNRLGQQIFIFLVLGIYFSWFWHKGQTLAMKTWHIRALDIHGQPLSKRRAWARYVLSWIWFVPPLVLTQWLGLPLTVGLLLCPIWIMLWACLTYFRADRQFVHDHWAGTRMVDVRPAKIAT